MNILHLNQTEKDTIRFAATWPGRPSSSYLTAELTDEQLRALAHNRYYVGPDLELYVCDLEGYLRTCANGIPCRYRCGGLARGHCKQVMKARSCGMVGGVCIHRNQKCNAYCEAGWVDLER